MSTEFRPDSFGTCIAPAENVPLWNVRSGVLLVLAGCAAALACAACKERADDALPSGKLQPAAAVLRSASRSPEDCAAVLRSGNTVRPPGRVRIGSWNLHWFPDGQDEAKAKDGGKDVAWVACAIAALEVDVLAVQEVKRHPRARDAIRELTRRLDRHTGGRWRLETMGCGAPETVHVGFLFDSSRVQAADFTDVAELNPEPDCTNQVGNGLAGYFAFPGGLDLHIVAVHFLAGDGRPGLDGRLRSYAALPNVVRTVTRRNGDEDIVVTGDFNTSGCSECSPEVTPRDEIQLLSRWLDEPGASLSLVPNTLPCTQGGSGGWQLLDHFAVRLGPAELLRGAHATVYGACLDSRCDDLPDEHVIERLSDHCPVVVNLADRDDD